VKKKKKVYYEETEGGVDIDWERHEWGEFRMGERGVMGGDGKRIPLPNRWGGGQNHVKGYDSNGVSWGTTERVQE